MFWWGIFVSSSQSFHSEHPFAYFTVASPLFITGLLFGLSGMPILERNANRRFRGDPAYLTYREDTSVLIPLPNWLYRSLPLLVKRESSAASLSNRSLKFHCFSGLLLFEWPVYAEGLQEEAQSVVGGAHIVGECFISTHVHHHR